MRRSKVGGVTRNRRGIVRDPCARDALAYELLLYRFNPARDAAVTVGLSWSVGVKPDACSQALRRIMKGAACVARYLRQPMTWVESLPLDEMNGWADVVGEILLEERGGGSGDAERRDPLFGMPMGDD